MSKIITFIKNMTPTKTILLGYVVIIFFGTFLLMLPVATRSGYSTGFLDSLFTATSSTCVTGLVRFDTYLHWSLFGQIVILCMIQIGGIGFMTFAMSLVSLTKKKIGVNQRLLVRESVSAPSIGGIVRMTRFIILGTAAFELLGTILLSFYYCPILGFGKGLFFSAFHAISAFCNAGFDLMGAFEPYSSLTRLSGNVYFSVVIMLLVVIGGLGFFVWNDIAECRFNFRRYKLHTKIVLTVSALLIFLGAAAIYFFEYSGTVFKDFSTGERVLNSFFQSISPRTAGFNSVDIGSMTQSSQLLIMILMIIGGSPGSTAGGIKTTTLAILLLSVFTTFRRRKSIECFRRRVDDAILRTASCVLMMYIALSLGSAMIVSWAEGIPVMTALFEVISAVGTVGLSLGVSPAAGTLTQIMLTMLMLFGRVGSLTMLLAFGSSHYNSPSKLPLEKVQIG